MLSDRESARVAAAQFLYDNLKVEEERERSRTRYVTKRIDSDKSVVGSSHE
jgi:hypothetical protein